MVKYHGLASNERKIIVNRVNLINVQNYFVAIPNGTISCTTLIEEEYSNVFSGSKAQREYFVEYSFYLSDSSDEGNACGFSNSKAQRERFAEHYDFSATNATVRDEETGFGYFGARYYDSELLTGWLSVDPMANKYPGISPYAYCAWTRPTGGDEHRWIKYNIVNNPVRLVDPDGRDIVLSESAQVIHKKYYRKKGYEKYTELYDKLSNDHSFLVTVKGCNDNERSKRERGAIGSIYESDDESDNYINGHFEIEWGDPEDSYGGTREHVYMEEMCHMGQAKGKDYDIYSTTIDDEYSAKLFSIRNCSDWIKDTFEDFPQRNIFPTELSIIRSESPTVAKKYLLEGIPWEIIRHDGIKVFQKVGGYYGYLQ